MTVTLLLDLDNTLLKNEMGVFLPAYFRSLQKGLSPLVPEEIMLPVFLEAVQEMMGKEHIDRTLLDVFYEYFCRKTGAPRHEINRLADSYYKSAYQQLKTGTTVDPGAQQAVRIFVERGYSLVVATNPLFPRIAIEHRVQWAELPVENGHFDLITSSEVFHFPKPYPAYYAEILGYLGWPDGPVVMIGNDPLNDVEGAGQLGLATYLVKNNDLEPAATDRKGSGKIEAAPAWIDESDPESLLPNFRTPAAILAIYKSTAAVLDSYVRFCNETAWNHRNGSEWTAREVLFHLKDVERQVNLPRVQSLIEQTNPFISGVDTDAWYEDGFPKMGSPRSILDDFLDSRLETIRLLSGLDDEDWLRPARHAIFGPTDILEIAYIMARHDQLHMRQFSELLSIV